MAAFHKDDHIPEEFAQELQELFSLYDDDQDGLVDLREVLTSIDKHISKEEIEEIIKDNCKNSDGQVGFEEFMKIMYMKMKEVESVEDYKGMFTMLDSHDDGYFTPEELRQAILHFGETISLEETTDLIKAIKPKDPGKISYDEFRHLVRKIVKEH